MGVNHPVTTSGIEVLLGKKPDLLDGKSLGVLVHQASIDSHLRYTFDRLAGAGNSVVKALFGPQHGIFGTTQENMIPWEGFLDRERGLRVHSLYGDTRHPTEEMMEGIDLFIIDLQDVGARYYTYLWTALCTVEVCARMNVPVAVLDRPNPIADIGLAGPTIHPDYLSFVGLFPLPVCHAMTMGEILHMINVERNLGCEIEVVTMEGWRRDMSFARTGLPWVPPSPNMPTPDTAMVYPGFCLLEGTNLSEGRGTTRPFEIFGAPFIEPVRLARELNGLELPGCRFRPIHFRPAFHKFHDRLCRGAFVHVTHRGRFEPVLTAVAVLATVRDLYGEALRWRTGPYEFEKEKLPIDILSGDASLREQVDGGTPPGEIATGWDAGIEEFRKMALPYIQYDPPFRGG